MGKEYRVMGAGSGVWALRREVQINPVDGPEAVYSERSQAITGPEGMTQANRMGPSQCAVVMAENLCKIVRYNPAPRPMRLRNGRPAVEESDSLCGQLDRRNPGIQK